MTLRDALDQMLSAQNRLPETKLELGATPAGLLEHGAGIAQKVLGLTHLRDARGVRGPRSVELLGVAIALEPQRLEASLGLRDLGGTCLLALDLAQDGLSKALLADL